MKEQLDSVLSYVETIEVTDPEVSALEASTSPPEFKEARQAVAIGSQITEFSDKVPADIRPHLANSLLLAQLAANKSIEGNSTKKWFKNYTEVLANIGWVVEGDLSSVHEVKGTGAEVRNTVIPVVTAALGGAAVASLIIPLLEGLEDSKQGWFTLFDQESKKASASQFQLCHVENQSNGKPKLSIVCFELNASKVQTQFLFFKFDDNTSSLCHSKTEMTIEPAILQGSKDAIAAKVNDHLSSFIANIEI